jgi:hypothetical protein
MDAVRILILHYYSNSRFSPSDLRLCFSYSHLPALPSSGDRARRLCRVNFVSANQSVMHLEKCKVITDIFQIFALLLIGIQLGLLICWSFNYVTRTTVPSAVLSFLAAFAILFLSRLEHSRSIQPSFLLSVYLLVSVIFDATQVRTLFLRHDKPVILGLSTANVAIKLILLALESKSKRTYLRAPYNDYPPEATSGIFNRSFFWWINPILATGFRKLITLDDLFTVDASLKSEVLLDDIEISWSKCKSPNLSPCSLLTSCRSRFGEICPSLCIVSLLKMEARSYHLPTTLPHRV